MTPQRAPAGASAKRRNLGLAPKVPQFGGQQQELWCEGGEVAFISQMIRESQAFARQVKWFTSLVSRGDNLPPLYRLLTEVGAVKVVKKEMAQGQKQSRFIAWSLWTTPNAVVHSNATRRPGCRRPASAAAARSVPAREPGAIEVLFHLGVEGKTHRPLLQRQGSEADA